MTADGNLRFLADESCHRAVITALREDGYDVYVVSEVMTRSIDNDLIQQAMGENRILLTEDKDFGWLVFFARVEPAGIILMRFPAITRGTLVASVRHTVQQYGDSLKGAFVAIQPGVVRFSRRSQP